MSDRHPPKEVYEGILRIAGFYSLMYTINCLATQATKIYLAIFRQPIILNQNQNQTVIDNTSAIIDALKFSPAYAWGSTIIIIAYLLSANLINLPIKLKKGDAEASIN